jgi:hypothetical protein
MSHDICSLLALIHRSGLKALLSGKMESLLWMKVAQQPTVAWSLR